MVQAEFWLCSPSAGEHDWDAESFSDGEETSEQLSQTRTRRWDDFSSFIKSVCVSVWVCACVRACVRAFMCVRVSEGVCVCVCERVS